ncbi:MAG: alanine--glyoxylate aminotransferase family protein [Gemmatimonadales bacterium]|nr:MAG: alanine--glyoxylate aminotransferase family protein [Gemmatimonadales bacterium]
MTRPGPLNSQIDPDGLMEFSVVFSDRSLNHMSQRFQGVMRDLSTWLKRVYSAHGVAVVPGGGTCAMEAVARQFVAPGGRALILRNGWFSFRWSQIIQSGALTESPAVVKARRPDGSAGPQAPFAPPPVDEVVARIRELRPSVVFAPHVETSAGVILPDEYVAALSAAAHEVGALFVLDCIASGCVWVDMKALGVDILITAPQKGWSAQPCAGVVLFSERALARLPETCSSSFALDLARWLGIMHAYEAGGHAYHATLPTDGLTVFRDTVRETMELGLDRMKAAQWELGKGVRALLAARGIPSVAAEGFEAPGVVVAYTNRPEVQSGKAFLAEGAQIAAGVPLRCDEGDDFHTFRLGLFGLDKLTDVPGTLGRLEEVLDRVF